MTDGEHDCDSHRGIGRRGFVAGCGAAIAFAALGTSVGTVAAQQEGDVAELLADLPDNWGRWGEDDELGALNLLGSPQAFDGMVAAMQRGRNGVARFPLQLSMTGEAITPDPEQPEVLFPDEDAGVAFPSTDTGDPAFPPRTPGRRSNTTPPEGDVLAGGVAFADDKFVTDLFLQGTTHLDALGHAWYGDQIYNGFDVATTSETKTFDSPLLGTQGADAIPGNDDRETLEPVTETTGLGRVSISNAAAAGVAGRGVLLDVGRALDDGDEHDRLPLGYEITVDDLRSTADRQGTEIRERDVLLIRTGAIERTRDPNAEWAPLDEPGLVFSEELVEWVHDMDVPYIGADNLAVERVTQVIDGETYVIPLHGAFLRDLGVYLNEIMWLSDLAATCANDGIYEFLFTAAPLNVERATGAPVNPVAIKATDPRDTGDGNRGDGRGEGRGSDGDGTEDS